MICMSPTLCCFLEPSELTLSDYLPQTYNFLVNLRRVPSRCPRDGIHGVYWGPEVRDYIKRITRNYQKIRFDGFTFTAYLGVVFEGLALLGKSLRALSSPSAICLHNTRSGPTVLKTISREKSRGQISHSASAEASEITFFMRND